MSQIDDALHPGNIMVVDDNPTNLKLLEDMLLREGYEVRSFPRGRLALAALEREATDLILLDITMPEMNGYEVCAELKSSPTRGSIPVIFLSALTAIEDKVKGFQAGAVDYISKPFQFEEVRARVDTHLKLQRALKAEHDLLERTLGGAVETLMELVQLSSPLLAMRSGSIKDIVLWMAAQQGIKDAWQYGLAASLCLVGCISLPDDVFERGHCGQTLTPDEDRMFKAHPGRTAGLVAKIPRLDVVAEIIRRQHQPDVGQPKDNHVFRGAQMLQLALALDRRLYRGVSVDTALTELRAKSDPKMLASLESYRPKKMDYDVRRLSIRELRPSMILENDALTEDGKMVILKKDTVLTETWIERLENFSKSQGIQSLIDVRILRQ